MELIQLLGIIQSTGASAAACGEAPLVSPRSEHAAHDVWCRRPYDDPFGVHSTTAAGHRIGCCSIYERASACGRSRQRLNDDAAVRTNVSLASVDAIISRHRLQSSVGARLIRTRVHVGYHNDTQQLFDPLRAKSWNGNWSHL